MTMQPTTDLLFENARREAAATPWPTATPMQMLAEASKLRATADLLPDTEARAARGRAAGLIEAVGGHPDTRWIDGAPIYDTSWPIDPATMLAFTAEIEDLLDRAHGHNVLPFVRP